MDDLDLIKQKINVVDLIQEYLPLKKSGINFKANCPFHSETTPSFMVSPERGIWHCFGCQKGGDIFKFVMEKEGLEFKDALETLAKKAGITLKRSSSKEKDYKQRLFEVNQKASQFFSFILTDHPIGKPALAYLTKRGLTIETIKEFGLGYAPMSWDSLYKFMKKRGFTPKELEDAGLLIPSKNGGYDRFRGRIIFTLCDVRGNILGFSGRILDKGEPKYLNSPQTQVFDKSKFLFGIHLAKGAIKEQKEAILVEGEMDMILSYQSGVKNIVASKGTALTEGQLELLQRLTNTLDICFDTDLAGDAASRRGIEMADKMGFDLKVVNISGAKDPAEICLEDVAIWKNFVKEASPIYDYYLESAEKRFNPKIASDKKSIYNELLPVLKKISNPVVKEHYTQKLSALLQIQDELIRQDLSRPESKVTEVLISKKDDQTPIKDRKRLLEDYLVSLLLHIPDDISYVPNFPETIFADESLRQIYVLLVLYLDTISFQGMAFRISDFVKSTPENLASIIDKLYLLELDERLINSKDWQRELANVISEIKKILLKTSLEKLSLQIRSAQEFNNLETVQTLNKRFRDLSMKLKNL